MKPVYSWILFDLDGTLTDPGEGITNSVAYALRHYGITPPPRRELYRFIGPPLMDSFRQFYGFDEAKAREAVEVYRVYFREKGLYENRVYEGIPACLTALKNAGFHLAVASSKPEPFVLQILRHFHLLDAFDFVGGALMDESRTRKEDVIAYVLERIGSPDPATVLMVGDRSMDVSGARALGLDSVGVTYGYGTAEEIAQAHPTFTAHTVEELQKVLSTE